MSDIYGSEDDDGLDEDLTSRKDSYSVDVSGPGLGVVLPATFEALQKENDRLGKAAVDDLGKRYDTYAQLLRDRRIGSSRKEQLIGALAAFAQPTRSGRFGEALGNSGAYLAQDMSQTRKEDDARRDMLAKLAFDRDEQIAKLQSQYGLQGLRFRESGARELARAAGKGGNRKVQLFYDPQAGGFAVSANADGSDARIVRATEAQIAAAGGADKLPPPPPGMTLPSGGGPAPVGPATAPAAAPATSGAPGAPPANNIYPNRESAPVGGQYKGTDNAIYSKAFNGKDTKISDPSPEDVAAAEGLKQGATSQAEATVKTQTDLENKARDASASLMVLREGRKLLDSGLVVTGIGAKQKLVGLQLLAASGDQDAAAKVAATQQYMNTTLRQLVTVLKAFGSGTGVSDRDVITAEQMIGKDTSLQPEALKFISDMTEKALLYAQKQAVRPDQARQEKQRRQDGKRPPLTSFITR